MASVSSFRGMDCGTELLRLWWIYKLVWKSFQVHIDQEKMRNLVLLLHSPECSLLRFYCNILIELVSTLCLLCFFNVNSLIEILFPLLLWSFLNPNSKAFYENIMLLREGSGHLMFKKAIPSNIMPMTLVRTSVSPCYVRTMPHIELIILYEDPPCICTCQIRNKCKWLRRIYALDRNSLDFHNAVDTNFQGWGHHER